MSNRHYGNRKQIGMCENEGTVVVIVSRTRRWRQWTLRLSNVRMFWASTHPRPFNITPCFIANFYLVFLHLTGDNSIKKFKEFTGTTQSRDMSSGLPIIYATLNVPTVNSYPSSRCLQWSGDGQACFVSKSAIYILVANSIQWLCGRAFVYLFSCPDSWSRD